MINAFAIFAVAATVTTCEQNPDTGVVTVRYDLDEAAVVTVDFQTNRTDGAWISIGEKNFTTLAGDVNRYVAADTDRVIRWHAVEDWPGHDISQANFRAVLTPWSTNNPPAYMCLDCCDTIAPSREYTPVRYYVSADAIPGGVHDLRYVRSHLLMRKIPCAGKVYRLGYDYVGVSGSSAGPSRLVKLTKDFYISVFQLTGGQYKVIQGDDNIPVMSLACADYTRQPIMAFFAAYEHLRGSPANGYDWPNDTEKHGKNDVGGYLSKIRARAGGKILFDLPTDAQYEIAARGGLEGDLGTGKRFNKSVPDWSIVQETAWTSENKDDGTDPENPVGGNTRHPHNVGLLAPNAYGLYDMLGNGSSRCRDWYATNPQSVTADLDENGILVDPEGPTSNSSSNRVVRSAGWDTRRTDYCWMTTVRRSVKGGTDTNTNEGNYTGARAVCPAVAPAL